MKPTYTYYDRSDLSLEERLLEAVDTPGIIVAVSGPSKSGKTVLCENVIGISSSLLVTGGGVSTEDALWSKIRTKLGIPSSMTSASTAISSREVSGEAKASVGVFVAKGEGAIGGKIGRGEQDQTSILFTAVNGVDLLEKVRDSKKTLVVDDFHYVDRAIQISIVEQFKEAARAGCTIVVVSVTHRSDDVLRANPDLRGRLRNIGVPYWSVEELKKIPELGFSKLNVILSPDVVDRLAAESLSSPQLMQTLCLDFCRYKNIDDQCDTPTAIQVNNDDLERVLRNVATASNCQTAYEILVKGPRVRGTARNSYRFKEGGEGDVYSVVLKAIAMGAPKLTVKYPELKDRVESIINGETPSGSSIVSSLTQMSDESAKLQNEDRVLEWDAEKDTLDFPDPYFMYYLRWK